MDLGEVEEEEQEGEEQEEDLEEVRLPFKQPHIITPVFFFSRWLRFGRLRRS